MSRDRLESPARSDRFGRLFVRSFRGRASNQIRLRHFQSRGNGLQDTDPRVLFTALELRGVAVGQVSQPIDVALGQSALFPILEDIVADGPEKLCRRSGVPFSHTLGDDAAGTHHCKYSDEPLSPPPRHIPWRIHSARHSESNPAGRPASSAWGSK